MKQYSLLIIAVLAAVIIALFSFDTADNPYPTRSYRTYSPSSRQNARPGGSPMPQFAPIEAVPDSAMAPVQNEEPVYDVCSTPPIENSGSALPPVVLSADAMTELTPVQLPPLDAGMVNVTSNGQSEEDGAGQAGGYRLSLPVAGSECRIVIPYDPSLLPQGFTEDDIRTYVYDRQYRRWVAIQRDSVNGAELLVCSRFRPWEKGLPHTQDAMVNPQDALAQVQDMMSFASQGEGGGDSPLDFINAVLKTPEMPETSAYTPTSIKELKAADPLEGLTLMQPPTANNSGTANLSYPIEIPAGRQGMQPNLALTYSSGGGNGWLGVGWDIPIPSITVETRWGVPRYDREKESEVYVYEGEQLVTMDAGGHFREMPHRTNQWTERQDLDQDGHEQFYPRRNEAFDSIVRHGSGPDSYWWSVTHKNGVTDYYGKRHDTDSADYSAVLCDPATRNIAQWMITESVDPDGNWVRYYYSVETHSGTSNGNAGRQIYIESIRYTGNARMSEDGIYVVVFNRKPDIPGRSDVSIAANRGFKEVTAATLCDVEIYNMAAPYHLPGIRSYHFRYSNDSTSHYKTRLSDVIRVDKPFEIPLCGMYTEADTMWPTTHFDYYDAPPSDKIFGEGKRINLTPYNDDVHSFFLTNAFGTEGDATALGGTRGKSWSIGGTATIGVGPVVPLTSFSVGGNFDYSRSRSEGALTLIDLDGDGLADKVFKKGKHLYYRRQIADGEYNFLYGDTLMIDGVADFLQESGSTTTWGLQASAGCAYSGSWPTSKSTTSTYFSDVNADGLPDLVTDDGVLFNVTRKGGRVTFQNYYEMGPDEESGNPVECMVSTPSDTCGGIIFDGEVSDSIGCLSRWTKDTVISCSNHTPDEAMEAIAWADSIAASGQYRYEISNIADIQNQKPFKITIFRREAYCEAFERAFASWPDPDLESVRVWVPQKNGSVSIASSIRLLEDTSGSRGQSRRCDGVRYVIQLCKNVQKQGSALSAQSVEILTDSLIGADDYTLHNVTIPANLDTTDLLLFRLISGDNRAFDHVRWEQTIRYTNLSQPLFYDNTTLSDNYIPYGVNNGYYNSRHDFLLSGEKYFGAGKPDVVLHGQGGPDTLPQSIRPSVRIRTGQFYRIAAGQNPASLTIEITKSGLTTPYIIPVVNNMDSMWDLGHFLSVREKDSATVRFTLSSDNHFISSYYSCLYDWGEVSVSPCVRYAVSDTVTRGILVVTHDTLECHPPVQMLLDNMKGTAIDTLHHRLFGPLYRGWGQFVFHDTSGAGGSDTLPVERLVLPASVHPSDAAQATGDTSAIGSFVPCQDTAHAQESSSILNAYESAGAYHPLSASTGWVEMEPDFRHQAWVGFGNTCAILRDTMSNTRLAGFYCDTNTSDIADYDHPVPVVPAGLQVKTVRKQNISVMKNHSLSLSIPVVPISVGVSRSEGVNIVLTDYMDLNGDRYPDIIGPAYVQYSQPWGGIGSVRPLKFAEEGVTSSATLSRGANFGGSYSTPSRCVSNSPRGSKISFDGAGNAGANLGGGSDRTSFLWMDVNGDGLPDRASVAGSVLKVCLNTGYGFLPEETWNIPAIRAGQSFNWGLNMGGNFNIGQASIGGGLGVNLSRNGTDTMLTDFNGDGLPDLLVRTDGGIRVRYAYGNGHWSPETAVAGMSDISYGHSYSESANASVTLGFTFFSILKVCAGISGSPYNRSFSKDSVQLTDINGDGYPDLVTSSSEAGMTVRYNRSAKTNLLRRVTNFTGSTIELDYDMQPSCYEKPQRSWNLARVETRNSDTLSPVGGNRTLTTFRYDNPNHNRRERMDYGYGKVTTRQHDTENNDSLYRYTVEEYENMQFSRRGRKTRECVYDATGRPYVEILYDVVMADLTRPADTLPAEYEHCPAFLYKCRETEIRNYYEGDSVPHATTALQREYDSRRNVTRYIHFGLGWNNPSHTAEYFAAEISYIPSPGHNLISLPGKILVKDFNGSLLQERHAEYDVKGHLVKLIQICNPQDAEYDFGYDTYGNLTHSVMPENASGQRLEFEYVYDNTAHAYPVAVDNLSLGFSSSAEYDYSFGKPTRTTDINGNEMRYAYDSLGRTVAIIAPNELADSVPYTIRMEYHPYFRGMAGQGVSYACTYHYDSQHPGNPIRTTLLADGLGRLLQTKKDAEIGGWEKSLVTGKVVYDCFGRTVAQYHPFVEDTVYAPLYNPQHDTATATTTAYDILDRPVAETRPYGLVTATDYGFDSVGGAACFRTTVTDPLGNSVTTLKGGLGQQLKISAPQNIVTLFEYDPLGRLTSSTDPDGFITTYDYDMLGRMFHRYHPDAGEDAYEYDPSGNMIRHINGNGQAVDYAYVYNFLQAVTYSDHPANNVRYWYGGPGAPDNCAGKVLIREDGSGLQTYKYGRLGELTENIRIFVLPNEHRIYTFRMSYEYDSWNRIRRMFYPDGEEVAYHYDRGGMLQSIHGDKNGDTRVYVEDIAYNTYGLKETVLYGNGAHTYYQYDMLMRLLHLNSENGQGEVMQEIDYSYDSVGNITDILNNAGVLSNGLGGDYWNHYDYDNLYRLSHAEGDWNGGQLNYHLDMHYFPNGRIRHKDLYADVMDHTGAVTVTDYEKSYLYHSAQPNTLKVVRDVLTGHHQYFYWDAAGNMTDHHDFEPGCARLLCWDEENRLMGFSDCHNAGFYQYDADGERTYKLTGGCQQQNINGNWYNSCYFDNATLYTSPYLVATPQGYTKHYYAESERVASRIGGGGLAEISQVLDNVDFMFQDLAEIEDTVAWLFLIEEIPWTDMENPFSYYEIKHNTEIEHFSAVMGCTNVSPVVEEDRLLELRNYWRDNNDPEPDCYWYHPDHLGSSSWITYTDGSAVQHLHYLPWGEDFVDQRTTSFNSMFTFSAKERDAETGLSYFGSRYYSSDLSIWLSVDPQASKYPSLSPYVYCANNPVKLVDPNGEEIGDYFNQYGKYLGTDCDDDGKIHIIQDNDWNNLKERISWEGIDGKRVISQDLGEILSEKPSSLDLTDDAIQKIVGHYNNTGLKLNRGNEGALNTEFEENGTSYTKKLTINISKWRNHSFLDNYYDIKSSFDHEKGHIKQCKGIGIVKFKKLSPYQQEEYAVDYQKSQPAFSRTSDKYKKWIDTYLQGKKK